MARDWKSIVDQMIDEARAAGQFDHLPRTGGPLKIDDNPYTPTDMKLAHKILKENDLAPDWVMLGKDIDGLRDRLLENMRQGLRAYEGALADAERSATPFEQRQGAELTWRRAQEAYQTAAGKLNREILTYNLKVPAGITQRGLFNVERELERLRNSKR